ncbi:gamma-type small acid-soluble spore protein [Halobacillus shinanisalinarum]|uniref:Gamma-type small acid-soluble spore protein n=1 Tax=Halobacillus shinanisalinarum TaxID=2932258 RepID=A0ABY4GVU3_9BACI|nr:gamma-type small acid-soluble spore protein [Halobacillus shinanisalinarum]UOQ92228.1 gamma-type small acid-soluble spore protein [Halobacillus shinanisalinarum]
MKENDNLTAAGTNIDKVKRKNEHSGMSYNEAKEFMAKTTKGHGTETYSDTDIEDVKRKNRNQEH